jgi:RHS repeat-associated protein
VSEESFVIDKDPKPTEKAVVTSAVTHRGRKVYELKNYLGNVLAVVSDVKIGLSTSSQMAYYVADYEPFGMPLAMRHFVSGDGYRFGFNGKEADDEWNGEGNMYNYGFRIHDPRLGRFLSVDPLAPDYPWYTPYQYAGNKVIDSIDLDGLEEKNAFEQVRDGVATAYMQHFKGLAQTSLGTIGLAWQYFEYDPNHPATGYDKVKMIATTIIPGAKLGFAGYEFGDAASKGDIEKATVVAVSTYLQVETDMVVIALTFSNAPKTASPPETIYRGNVKWASDQVFSRIVCVCEQKRAKLHFHFGKASRMLLARIDQHLTSMHITSQLMILNFPRILFGLMVGCPMEMEERFPQGMFLFLLPLSK